jgi:exodeoxyribonuclease-3
MRVLSWNVNGLRSIFSKASTLQNLLAEFDPDVLCLQEIKCDAQTAQQLLSQVMPNVYVSISQKKGYAGVALCSKIPATRVREGFPDTTEFSHEGRLLTAEFAGGVTVCCVYTPNSKPKLERLDERVNSWEPMFRDYTANLHKGTKHVVVIGDLNVAPEAVDVHDPKRLVTSPGFTPQEREAFAALTHKTRLVDAFRALHQDAKEVFTYWSYLGRSRERNKGWRIDLALVSEATQKRLKRCEVLSEVMGSDHCPLFLEF